jgi:hypothetical protein
MQRSEVLEGSLGARIFVTGRRATEEVRVGGADDGKGRKRKIAGIFYFFWRLGDGERQCRSW